MLDYIKYATIYSLLISFPTLFFLRLMSRGQAYIYLDYTIYFESKVLTTRYPTQKLPQQSKIYDK